jgi:hypothetical protein
MMMLEKEGWKLIFINPALMSLLLIIVRCLLLVWNGS